MKNYILTILLLVTFMSRAQEKEYSIEEINIDPFVKGTLLTPSETYEGPLVVLLQGSGPTDRNGNQSLSKNDAIKKLALAFAEKGIASYRYDKRIFQADRLGIREKDMRFDDFIVDAKTVLDHFKEYPQFQKLVIVGHSQGSLVGMIAARDRADAFISLAGLSQPVDSLITQQITKQAPTLKESVQRSFQEMREKGSTKSYHPILESVFRPAAQPFLLSWMVYNPKKEIAKLDIPVLIVYGDKDLQVEEMEAEELKAANPKADLKMIEGMNHVLRKIEGDDLDNSKSYNEAHRPLHPELIEVLVDFIKNPE